MKNILKVWLKRRQLYNNPNSFYAQTTITNSLSTLDIIDEMVKDGLVENYECSIKFMNNFNRKSAELLAKGNNIDTGLVKMHPQINGLIQNKTWNPDINNISTSFSEGTELLKALKDTEIEIIGADEEVPEIVDYLNLQSTQYKDEIGRNAELNSSYRKSNNDNPPCGIAFRNWILNA